MYQVSKIKVAASILAIVLAIFSTEASAVTCDAQNQWKYNGTCYPTQAAAEHALRHNYNSSGKPQDGNWRIYFELKEQIGNRYVYDLPPRPHLTGTEWKTWMANGLFAGQWNGYDSPTFDTYQEAESWLDETAALPTPAGANDIVSDDLAYRGSRPEGSGLVKRFYSHNYTAVAVARTDLTITEVLGFTPGVEEATVGANNHLIYQSELTPDPVVYHQKSTPQPHNGVIYHYFTVPVIDIDEKFVSSPCESPYSSDGTECVSSVEESIYFGPENVLTPPEQPCTPQNNSSNPCDPANGNKSQTEIDYISTANGGLSFSRFYNSKGAYKTADTMAPGWRHTYSRALDEVPDKAPTLKFASVDNQSSSYPTPAAACTSGWGDIKDDVWSGDLSSATATFSGGNVCKIEVGGVVKAYFPVRSGGGFGGYTPAATIKTVTRANGASVKFELVGPDWINLLNPSLSLEQSGSNWVFTDTNDTKDTFNSQGQLISVTARNGRTETLVYNLTTAQGGDDDSDTLDRVTGPFGHTLTFDYDGSGRLDSVATPDGTLQYAYLSSNLSSVTYPDSTVRQYVYEDSDYPNHLTGIIDENNDRFATWGYDDEGRAILSEHAGGKEQVTFVYNANGTTTLTMGNGASRDYVFSTEQGSRKLTQMNGDVCSTCPGGEVADRTFDANGFRDEVLDWNGNTTQTLRNGRGLTETLIAAKGSTEQRTTTTVWEANFRLPKKITSPKNVTDFVYDANGNPTLITTSSGVLTRSWGFTYNSSGQPLTINGPRTDVNDTTILDYYDCTTGNECGQLEDVTNALGQVTTYDSYDASGRLKQMTDPNGLQTDFTYDGRGNMLSTTQTPLVGTARVTTLTYDDVGQLKTISTPDGMVLTYGYDAAHYLRSITDNLGNYVNYDYDVMGNLKDEDTYDPGSALKRAVDYVHDINDRLDTVNNGGFSTDLTMDLVGNMTNETDPELAVTQHSYDALNRLEQTIDALTGVIDYGYDDHDNLTSVTAANGAHTTYEYDNLDNLKKETSPDRGTITYTYDNAGNQKTMTDARGKITTYAYDALNRQTLMTLHDSSTIAYEYDVGTNAIGRLNKITDASGQTTWSFDNFGAVTSKTQTIGAVALTTGYTYDANGRLSTMTYPSGKVATYGYNVFLPNSITVDGQTILYSATYDPFGPANGWIWGNGSPASRNFDLRGLMTSIDYLGDTQAIGYDSAGRPTTIVDNNNDIDFDYDLMGRVTDFSDNRNGGSSTMFTSKPAVLADIQTYNNESGNPPSGNPTPWITAGLKDITSSSAKFALERSQVNQGSISQAESIGYIAFEDDASGTFTANGNTIKYEAQRTALNIKGWDNNICRATNFLSGFTAAPLVVSTINSHAREDGAWARRCSLTDSAFGIKLDEDQYKDNERKHDEERVGYAAFSEDFDAMFTGANGLWRMEAAQFNLTATTSDPTFKQITFRQQYATPPIVVVLATNQNSDPTAIRVRNVTITGFQAVQVEPANENGEGAAMTMHYLAIEPGSHELPDGTRLHVGSVSTTSQQHGSGVSGSESWTTVNWPSWSGSKGYGIPIIQQLTYDANGNRESNRINTPTYSYTNQTNSNRILSAAGPIAKTYGYDASGNVTSDGVHTYSYDDRGRLTSVDAGAATYQHNGQGQRVKKHNGSTTLFVYDEVGGLIGEYNSSGVAIQETVWFAGAPVAVLKGSDEYYVHTDQLGTPRVITDGNTMVWRWQSSPFGEALAQEDPDGDSTLFTYNLRFSGQYFDSETGLHYNYFRTYDPSTGRYLESDPIGLDGGLNTYGYAYQNPLTYTDPMGLDPATATATAQAALYCTGPQAAACAGGAAVAAVGLTSAYAGTKFYDAFATEIGTGIEAVVEACTTDAGKEKNCRALYDTIIRSCWSIQNPKTRQRCFEAAKATYESCMAED